MRGSVCLIFGGKEILWNFFLTTKVLRIRILVPLMLYTTLCVNDLVLRGGGVIITLYNYSKCNLAANNFGLWLIAHETLVNPN